MSTALESPACHGRAALAAAVALLLLLVIAAPAQARIMQADDQLTCVVDGGDVSGFMRAHHASVLRIIVPYAGSTGALGCAQRAAAEGYRDYISFQYDNAWRPARVAAYYRRVLPKYAPYAWAVSLGNEQDLAQGAPPPHGRSRVCIRGGGCRPSSAGEDYRAVWNAVWPVIARLAPRAVRVYGETSPFGFTFLKDSFRSGRARGAQAIAFHCYDVKGGGLRVVPQVAAWAASWRLPLWCSEMSAAVLASPHRWLRRDTPAQWGRLLAITEARSPNLKMVSYYRWPQIGAF